MKFCGLKRPEPAVKSVAALPLPAPAAVANSANDRLEATVYVGGRWKGHVPKLGCRLFRSLSLSRSLDADSKVCFSSAIWEGLHGPVV